MISGIYKITNPKGKIYIGQTINLENRKHTYISKPNAYKGQTKLYNSIQYYGWDKHIWEIIEYCEISQLLEREYYYKHQYKVLEYPSLCCKIEGSFGRVGQLSDETRNKISVSNLGKKRSIECKEKMSKHPTKGKNISKSLTGYKQTEQHKINRKNSGLGKVGRKHKNKVIQRLKTGEIIKIWDNVTQIKEILKLNVYDAIEKRNNTAGGFIWDWYI
jgi:group I intron endonuclease